MSSDAARKALDEAITRLHADAKGAATGGPWDRASVAPIGEHLRVAYFGDPWAEGCDGLFETIARASVARYIGSLELVGDDVGAEGTCDWELDALTPPGAAYPAMTTFRVSRGAPFRQNRLLVVTHGVDRADGGALARIADLAPKLEVAESPSAPDDAFLARKRESLRVLEVDAGQDHGGFVLDLAARGAALPKLESFAWGDPLEPKLATPREDWVALFRSQTFARLRHFTWRNPPFTESEIDGLVRNARGPKMIVERWSKPTLRRLA